MCVDRQNLKFYHTGSKTRVNTKCIYSMRKEQYTSCLPAILLVIEEDCENFVGNFTLWALQLKVIVLMVQTDFI